MQLKKVVVSLMLVLSTSVMAEPTTEGNSLSGFYGSIGQVNFDDKSSTKNYISDSATFWKLGWEQHNDQWIWGAGISGYLYSDHAGFSQNTTDGNKDSGATALNGYLEGGYKYSVNKNINFSILAGYEHVFASSREIGLCSNCYSEDIDISAGIYIQPRATYIWDNGWYVNASYSSYTSGDVDSALFLTIGVLY